MEQTEKEVQPRSEECGNCGKNTLYVSDISYGSWSDTGRTTPCSKYGNRYDMIQVRDMYVTYKCANCKYMQTTKTFQNRVYCNH